MTRDNCASIDDIPGTDDLTNDHIVMSFYVCKAQYLPT